MEMKTVIQAFIQVLCVMCCHEEYEYAICYRSSLASLLINIADKEQSCYLRTVIHDIWEDLKWYFFLQMVHVASLFHSYKNIKRYYFLPESIIIAKIIFIQALVVKLPFSNKENYNRVTPN